MSDQQRLFSADLYTSVVLDGDIATISFTSYSLGRMEEMMALDLWAPGARVVQSEPCGSVDVMKALIDIPAPVSGIVVATNPLVIESPDLSKDDPFGEGWLLRVRLTDPGEIAGLLSAVEYDAK